MKILYVIQGIQHPARPGSQRHYYFLRALSQHHSITLLAPAPVDFPPAAKAEIESYVDYILTVPVRTSASPHRFGISDPLGNFARRVTRKLRFRAALRTLRERFRELAQREAFDVVLFHGKGAYPVVEGFRELPIVADFCDATAMRQRGRLQHAQGMDRVRQLVKYIFARRTDRKLLDQADYLSFISPRDQEAAVGNGGTRGVVIPNGIDLDYWQRRTTDHQPNCLVFTGVMNYPPNEDAALHFINDILPLLRARRPDVEFFVVGRDPTPALIEVARNRPEVTVTGFVEDVRPYLERASLFVAPLRFASGMQNKILEALSMEVPVVTTSVAANGIQVDEASPPPLRVADGADPFTAAILSLLANEEEQVRMAAEGRRFVEARFDWDRSAAMLEALCLEAAGLRSPSENETSNQTAGVGGMP